MMDGFYYMTDKKNAKRIISMVLKAVTAICALAAVLMCVFLPEDDFMGGARAFMYFTIQSNIWIGIVCAVGLARMIKGKAQSRKTMLIKFIFTVSITLTGCVFCFMLAPQLGAKAWELNSLFAHVIVPVCSVADFLLTGGDVPFRKWDEWFDLLPPLYYVLFAALGYVCNWQFAPGQNYPYFFLNWGSEAGAFGFSEQLPFIGVMWWILILLVLLLGCGKLYILLVEKIHGGRKTDDN